MVSVIYSHLDIFSYVRSWRISDLRGVVEQS